MSSRIDPEIIKISMMVGDPKYRYSNEAERTA